MRQGLKSVKEVIHLLDVYLSRHPGDTFQIRDFAVWMLSHESKQSAKHTPQLEIDGLIAMLVAFMSHYAEFYTRKILKKTMLYSSNDFGMLITLRNKQRLSKAALIREVILEKPTGTEVIKRLLRQGLIHEIKVPSKRQVCVELTPKGVTEIERVSEKMRKVARHIAGDLRETEKRQLLNILIKLHAFHQPYFERNKTKEVLTLLEKED